jgi:hypothetical protein
MKARQRITTSVLPSQQRLHKLRFLQKLGCQKPCWDKLAPASFAGESVEQLILSSSRKQENILLLLLLSILLPLLNKQWMLLLDKQ